MVARAGVGTYLTGCWEAAVDVLIRQSGRRKQREMTTFLAAMTGTNLANPDRDLTKTAQDSRFCLFRGHLSRPACSHVKKLAKQAGDASDPGRTYRSGRVFYGLISAAANEPFANEI